MVSNTIDYIHAWGAHALALTLTQTHVHTRKRTQTTLNELNGNERIVVEQASRQADRQAWRCIQIEATIQLLNQIQYGHFVSAATIPMLQNTVHSNLNILRENLETHSVRNQIITKKQ